MRNALFGFTILLSTLIVSQPAMAAVKDSAETKAAIAQLNREEAKQRTEIDEDFKDKEEAVAAEIQEQKAAGTSGSESKSDLASHLKKLKQQHRDALKDLHKEYQEKRADVHGEATGKEPDYNAPVKKKSKKNKKKKTGAATADGKTPAATPSADAGAKPAASASPAPAADAGNADANAVLGGGTDVKSAPSAAPSAAPSPAPAAKTKTK